MSADGAALRIIALLDELADLRRALAQAEHERDEARHKAAFIGAQLLDRIGRAAA